MERNYEALRNKILGKYGKLGPFAAELGLTPSTLSIKLSGASDWKREEIERCYQLLDLTEDEIMAYFF